MNFDFALLTIGNVHSDYRLEYDNVCNYFTRIFFIKEGSGTIWCGNEKHDIKPDTMYLVPPLLTHSVHCQAPTSLYYLTFTDQSMHIYDHFHLYKYNLEKASLVGIDKLMDYIATQAPGFNIDSLAPDKYDSSIMTMQRVKTFRQLPASSQMSINGLLHVLLAQFMDQNAPIASVNDIRISKALWGINRDLAHIPSLDEISANACLNKNTFIRLFRLQTGFTPTDYIIRRRIQRAQFLFISGNRSVKEVAHQVGYDNISYFGRTFKRIVGMSPLEFIHQNESS